VISKLDFDSVFLQKTMNQQRLSRLTASAIATVVTTTLCFGVSQSAIAQQSAEQAEQQATEQPNSALVSQPELNESQAVDAQPTDPEAIAAVPSQQAQVENLIAQIYAHRWGEDPAATLYVRGIPVLTFIDPDDATARSKSNGFVTPPPQAKPIELNASPSSESLARSNASNYDPVWRATTVAARLNYLSQNNLDANAIAVAWNEDLNAYLISIDGEALVTVDRRTILPDTTRNLTQDALQVTNRLRRLLGNAPPLPMSEIAMRPNPNAAERLTQTEVVGQQRGMASWYGPGFHGRRSASGERFDQYAMTAAHRTLPFGTVVRVTNLNNGQSIVVRINDRGPFSRGRIIDLSAAAARKLGMMGSGVAPVQVEVLAQ
jgi:rare lipoprotein A